MPMHDWTRVDDGTYHHFHMMWGASLTDALNGGGLRLGAFTGAGAGGGGGRQNGFVSGLTNFHEVLQRAGAGPCPCNMECLSTASKGT